MLSSIRFAGIITVIFAVCGPARAQEIAPPGFGVSIRKVTLDNGLVHTVKYHVTGGSPRLQALVRRVEWVENELSVIEQLQMLKLESVVNERRVAAFRTAQLTNPYFPPGFIPASIPTDGGDADSFLQRALKEQLADAATPEAALQLIGFMELVQTQLDAELKALPPQEQKEAQGPIDALRAREAALARGDVPPPPPQPVVPDPVRFPAPAVPQQLPMPPAPIAFKQIEVEWGQKWWPAEVLRVNGAMTLIHYTGWDSSWDEWVPAGRIRPAGTVSAPPQRLPMPQDSTAFQQMVLQNQERVREQIMQTQIMQQNQLRRMGLRH
jgi:hypothetical protein